MGEIVTKVVETKEERIYQGEFIKDVEYIEFYKETEGEIEISIIEFPLVVVLTQECDASQDYKNRIEDNKRRQETNGKEGVERNQFLLSIIVAPVYLLEDLKSGKHLENLGINCRTIGSQEIKKIQHNADSRFHYMNVEVINNKRIEYVVDFKQYFTVNVDKLLEHKKDNKHVQFILGDLFKESLSQRFSNYLSRIGLPESDEN